MTVSASMVASTPLRPSALSKRTEIGDGGWIILLASLAAVISYGLPLMLGAGLGVAWVTVIALLSVLALSLCCYVLDPRCFLLYWLSLVLLQNAAAGFWHGGSSGSVPYAVTEAKTIALGIGALLVLPRLMRLLNRSYGPALLLAVYGLGLAMNIGVLNDSALANLRNFVLPVLLVFVSWAIAFPYSQVDRMRFVRVVLCLTSFWLVLGTLGELVLGTQRWREIFSSNALGGLNSLAEETTLFGFALSRTGGILFEPVNAGYVAASVVVVLFLMKLSGMRGPVLWWWVCMSGSLTTLFFAATKNALLMFLIAACFAILSRYTRLPIWIGVVGSWILSVVVTLGYGILVKGISYGRGVWADPVGVSGGESTSIHMAGLVSGIKSLFISPFGHGIGSGGNFFRLYNPGISRELWLSTGSESAVGTLAYQAGLLGFFGFLGLVLVVACCLGWYSAILLAVWSSAAFFAESFFGPIACSVLLLSAPFFFRISPLFLTQECTLKHLQAKSRAVPI